MIIIHSMFRDVPGLSISQACVRCCSSSSSSSTVGCIVKPTRNFLTSPGRSGPASMIYEKYYGHEPGEGSKKK